MNDSQARLKEIRLKIEAHINAILTALEPFLTGDQRMVVPASSADIKKIYDSSLLLKQKIEQLLDKGLTEQNSQNSEEIAKIRHDLKNPINAMQGFTEIVIEELQEAGKISYIAAFSQVLALVHQILGLIDTVRIEKPPSSEPSTMPPEPSTGLEKRQESAEYRDFKEKFSILIVDDHEENCQLLERYLRRMGFKRIVAAYNGLQALGMLEKGGFDLMLLDIDMPGMTGIEVLSRLTNSIAEGRLMVLMISALDTMEHTVKCINLGAEDFLTKPFNADLLRVRINSCVEKKWFINKEQTYRVKLEFQNKQFETLLYSVFPPLIAKELSTLGEVKPSYYKNVAILFADVVHFTTYCENHEPAEIVHDLQEFVDICEVSAAQHNLQKIKTIGDCFVGVAGMLTASENPVLDCIQCAEEFISGVAKLPMKWQLRIGIHLGSVIGGIVGHRQYQFDIWGDAVNITARIQALAEPNKIFLSKAAFESVQSVCFAHSLGLHEIRGRPSLEIFMYEGRKDSNAQKAL